MSNAAIGQIAKALQQQASTAVNIRTGTTLSGTNRDTGVVTVALDHDPNNTPVSAISIDGVVQIGARVLMLAYPPRGLVVLGQIGGTPNLQYLESHDFTDQTVYTSATPTLGSPTVGFTFKAPATGSILLEVSPFMDVAGMNTVTSIGAKARVFGQVRIGNVIGAGTVVWNGDGDPGPLVVFENQKTGATLPGTTSSVSVGSGQTPVTGLIPNQTYNASMWHRMDVAFGSNSVFIMSRRITGLLVV